MKRLCASAHDGILAIRDFDGYDHDLLHMSLTEVLNFPNRKMGHAFVIKAIPAFGIN